MSQFGKNYTPLQFSEHILNLILIERLALNKGLNIVAKEIKKTAKSEFGHYQKSHGNFPEWAELAESTLEDKYKKGYAPPDNPLLRTGELKNSIQYEVHNLEAIVGSKNELMVYHEFGTSKMPMRPVIGPAVFRNKNKIKKILGKAFVYGFYNESEKIHSDLGYDMKIGVDEDV